MCIKALGLYVLLIIAAMVGTYGFMVRELAVLGIGVILAMIALIGFFLLLITDQPDSL